MKATVLESANGKCVILAEDGMFYNTAGSYRVGETIEYNVHDREEKRFVSMRSAVVSKAAAIAACLVLLLSGATYSYQNLMVYADVTLESEMPVTWRINRKHEVIAVKAVDQSGVTLTASMSRRGIKGETIEEAISYAEKYVRKHSKSGKHTEFNVVVDCKDEKDAEELAIRLNEELSGGTEKYAEELSSSEAGSENSSSDKKAAESEAAAGQTAGTQTDVKANEQAGKKSSVTASTEESITDVTPSAGEETGESSEEAAAESEESSVSQESSEDVQGQEVSSQETSGELSSQEVVTEEEPEDKADEKETSAEEAAADDAE